MNIFLNNPNKEIVLNFSTILLCLLPIALISGPFLSDLFISTIAIIFLFLTFRYKLYYFYKKKIFFLALFLYIAMILSSLFSENIIYSLKHSFFYFRFILFSLGVAFLIENNKVVIKYFSYSLFITIIVLLVDSYIQYITGYNIFLWERSSRLTSLFADRAALGIYLSRMIILSFALLYMLGPIKKSQMIFALIFLILSEVIVFLSGDRSPLFLLTLSTLIIICLVEKLRYLRIASFIIAVIAISLISNFDQNIKTRVFYTSAEQIGLLDNSKKINYFSPTHEQIALTAINQFKDKPIFGHGLKMFRVKCSDPRYLVGNGCSTHPHNTYLQLFAEVGILGALPVLISFGYVTIIILNHAIRILRRKSRVLQDYEVCLYSLFFINLFPLIPTLSFFNNWNSVMIYLPLSFILINFDNQRTLAKRKY